MTETDPFDALGLTPQLRAAVARLGFTEPTPIQAQAVPPALKGRDVVGRARTGSGKTLAFALPILQRLRAKGNAPQAMIIAPTRELALQVTAAIDSLIKDNSVRTCTVYGGVAYDGQLHALRKGVDVVVGTPGRMVDLVKRDVLNLSGVHMAVLDEADEMLNMGFIDDVQTLLAATQSSRQTMLFSASMPAAIRAIANTFMRNPIEVQVEEQALTVEHIDQSWMRVPAAHKIDTLHAILGDVRSGTVLVFTGTRIGCVDVADALNARGLSVDRLHGALPQDLRERVLGRVRDGAVRVLIATDVASRGIDVQHIGLVVNYDIPEAAERYVHRIGRTARAGRSGRAISLVTPKQKRRMREIADALGVAIPQAEVPTRGGLLAQEREALGKAVVDASTRDLTFAAKMVSHLSAQHNLSVEQVAAAALHALASARDVSLDPSGDHETPEWIRPVQAVRPPSNTNETQVVLSVGKRQKVTASAIVRALVANCGVAAGQIGRIRLEPRRSLVGLSRADARVLLQTHRTVQVGDEIARISGIKG